MRTRRPVNREAGENAMKPWGRGLALVYFLAASIAGSSVVRQMRANAKIETITEFGPLPDIYVPWIDYVTLCLSFALILAAILEIAGKRVAAPLALFASLGISVFFYFPELGSQLTGSPWFATVPGRSFGVTWQMFAFHFVSLAGAAFLTYHRYRR